MRLSNRHAQPQTITRADFSGGLNTTANVDGIAENQLVDCLNIEIEHNTGRMKSVAGTVEVVHSEKNIFAAMWDEINKKILLVFEDKTVHVLTNSPRLKAGDSAINNRCFKKEVLLGLLHRLLPQPDEV